MAATFRDLIAANKRNSALLVFLFILFTAAVALVLALGVQFYWDPAAASEIQWVRADTVEGRAADVLEFVPTSADPLFSRAVIWLERQTLLPRRLELDERSGVHRTLTLSRIRLGAPVAKREFVFEVPKGVRVIER